MKEAEDRGSPGPVPSSPLNRRFPGVPHLGIHVHHPVPQTQNPCLTKNHNTFPAVVAQTAKMVSMASVGMGGSALVGPKGPVVPASPGADSALWCPQVVVYFTAFAALLCAFHLPGQGLTLHGATNGLLYIFLPRYGLEGRAPRVPHSSPTLQDGWNGGPSREWSSRVNSGKWM